MRTPFLYILLFALSCKNSSNERVVVSKIDSFISNSDTVLYFPKDSFFLVSDSTNKEGDIALKSEFSKLLQSLDEPLIYNTKVSDTNNSLRLLWIRAFENPIIMRISSTKNKYQLMIKEAKKEYYNDNDYKYVKVKDSLISISEKEWENILDALDKQNFSRVPISDQLGLVEDATHWIFEVKLNSNYRCITRVFFNKKSLQNFIYIDKMLQLSKPYISLEEKRLNDK